MEELKVYEDKMNKTLDVLLSDFGTIRAGRANPHVLDKIKVDYYGTPTPLQQVGNVSVPEARMIVIQPSSKLFTCCDQKAVPHASFNASMVPYLASHHVRNMFRKPA